jgi:hypothetical protein
MQLSVTLDENDKRDRELLLLGRRIGRCADAVDSRLDVELGLYLPDVCVSCRYYMLERPPLL